MKRYEKLFGFYAAIAAMAASETEHHEDTKLTEEERKQLRIIAESKQVERLKEKGVNEYFYGDNVIYARNQKNADRKARNKGYL